MRGSFIAALAVFALTAPPVVANNPADLLIRHATVVDVEHAQTAKDQAIATRDGRIVAVGTMRLSQVTGTHAASSMPRATT
jgi:imidazolonepropionase-like amidohydrolase